MKNDDDLDHKSKNEMIVKRVSVPIGLEELMEGLTKEVIEKNPLDICAFASKYFAKLLELRSKGSLKELQPRKLPSSTKRVVQSSPQIVSSLQTQKRNVAKKLPVKGAVDTKAILAKRNILRKTSPSKETQIKSKSIPIKKPVDKREESKKSKKINEERCVKNEDSALKELLTNDKQRKNENSKEIQPNSTENSAELNEDASKQEKQSASAFDVEKLHKEIKEVEEIAKTSSYKNNFNPLLLREEIKKANIGEENEENKGEKPKFGVLTAAIKIQSLWRGYKLRKSLKQIKTEDNLKILSAALKIQSLWRGYRVRKCNKKLGDIDKIKENERSISKNSIESSDSVQTVILNDNLAVESDSNKVNQEKTPELEVSINTEEKKVNGVQADNKNEEESRSEVDATDKVKANELKELSVIDSEIKDSKETKDYDCKSGTEDDLKKPGTLSESDTKISEENTNSKHVEEQLRDKNEEMNQNSVDNGKPEAKIAEKEEIEPNSIVTFDAGKLKKELEEASQIKNIPSTEELFKHNGETQEDNETKQSDTKDTCNNDESIQRDTEKKSFDSGKLRKEIDQVSNNVEIDGEIKVKNESDDKLDGGQTTHSSAETNNPDSKKEDSIETKNEKENITPVSFNPEQLKKDLENAVNIPEIKNSGENVSEIEEKKIEVNLSKNNEEENAESKDSMNLEKNKNQEILPENKENENDKEKVFLNEEIVKVEENLQENKNNFNVVEENKDSVIEESRNEHKVEGQFLENKKNAIAQAPENKKVEVDESQDLSKPDLETAVIEDNKDVELLKNEEKKNGNEDNIGNKDSINVEQLGNDQEPKVEKELSKNEEIKEHENTIDADVGNEEEKKNKVIESENEKSVENANEKIENTKQVDEPKISEKDAHETNESHNKPPVDKHENNNHDEQTPFIINQMEEKQIINESPLNLSGKKPEINDKKPKELSENYSNLSSQNNRLNSDQLQNEIEDHQAKISSGKNSPENESEQLKKVTGNESITQQQQQLDVKKLSEEMQKLSHVKSLEEDLEQHLKAAIKIQAAYRGYQTRKGLEDAKNPQRELSDIKEEDEHNLGGASGIGKNNIETTTTTPVRRMDINAAEIRKSSVVGVQKAAKRKSVIEVEAATKIQAGFRGYKVRKQLKSKNRKDTSQDASLSKRRRRSNGNSGGAGGGGSIKRMKNANLNNNISTKNNNDTNDEELEEQSAVKIQAGIRGFLVRRRQQKQQQTEQ